MKKSNLVILLSLILGIVGGLCIPEFMKNIAFLGTIYINLLKFMIIPIIFTTIMVTIYNSKEQDHKNILKAIIIFIIMFTITFLLSTVVVMFFSGDIDPLKIVKSDFETTSLKFSEIIINLFPDNIITMISTNSILACILLAFCFGFAASKVDNGKKVIDFFSGLRNIFHKLLEWIMLLTPIGVLSLAGFTTATYGSAIIGLAFKYIWLAYLTSIIVLVFIMILPVWITRKINPLLYIKKMWKLWILTMTTCSSLATLPATLKTCKEEFNMKNDADFLVPVGCTIHRCGGAVSFALLSIFCHNLFGIEITLSTYLVMLVSALLINMAAPGIPSGGIVLGTTYLALLNIPLSFVGIYSGVYRLLDMAYTSLNVTGNVSANIIMKKKK